MRIIKLTLALVLAMSAALTSARAADTASVHAILITASKEKAAADPRLAPYEATLQRNLPESSFRYVAEGSAALSGNSRARIALGRDHSLTLEGGEKGPDGIRLTVEWANGSAVVMRHPLTFQPGVPVVLGHRLSGDGEVPIVIVTVK